MLSRGPHLLIPDAPIGAPSKHERLTSNMARRLLADGTFNNADDATQSLRASGFQLFDIMLLIDDARQAAFQHVVDIVAEAMADV
jgi:hypothetical protein